MNEICLSCRKHTKCGRAKHETIGCGYYVPMTNEEWFCGLSTEEKVSALLNLHEKVRQRMRTDIGGENSFYKGDYYREWLMEIHKE